MLFSKLLDKEVICASSGQRIGFLDDVELDPKEYRMQALICYGKPKNVLMFGRAQDIRIPIEQVLVVGEDSILVQGDYNMPAQTPKGDNVLQQLFS